MRIKRKDEFGDIGTVVYYNFHYFIPDPDYVLDPELIPTQRRNNVVAYNNYLTKGRIQSSPAFKSAIQTNINYFRAAKRLIQGSKKKFSGIDFAEYDFNAILDDHKFNNKDLISYLDLETASKVGTSLGSLEKINSTLFPTLSDSNAQANDVEYFGTLSLSAITLYLFSLDPEMYKIELYEDIIEENNSTYGGFVDSDCLKDLGISHTEPVVTIYLGPSQECQNNPPSRFRSGSSMYSTNDPLGNNRNNYYEIDPCEYSKLYDEIFAGKVVWLALSSDKSIKEVNLSYNAWLHSEDANIFKSKFNLRNDEFFNVTNRKYIKESTTDCIDTRSGKLLGNSAMVPNIDNPKQSSCPILSRKLKELESTMYPGGSTMNDEGYMILPDNAISDDGYLPLDILVESDNCAHFFSEGRDSGTPMYNPEVEYRVGDQVFHQDKVYKAIRSGNRGHLPDISPFWVLDDKVNDAYTTRLTILSDPQDAGKSNPSKQITIVDTENLANIDFSVSANLGYKLADVQIEHDDDSRENLIKNKDYTDTDIVDGDDYYNFITLLSSGIKKVLGEDSKKRVIFKFNTTAVSFVRNYTLDDNGTITTGGIINRGFSSSPTSYSSDIYKIVLAAITKNGVRTTQTSEISNYLNNAKIHDELILEFALVDYKHEDGASRFLGVTTTKRADGETRTEEFKDFDVRTVSWEYASGHTLNKVPVLSVPVTVDFDSIEINVTAATKLTYTVSEYNGFEVNTVNAEVNYGGSQTIQFYGTYRDALKEINISGIVITGLVESLTIPGVGIVTLHKSGSMYTLIISSITGDIDIKIIER